jgi:hypothetical protein
MVVRVMRWEKEVARATLATAARSKRDSSTARADAFAGSEREEKASARSGRNDRFLLFANIGN